MPLLGFTKQWLSPHLAFLIRLFVFLGLVIGSVVETCCTSFRQLALQYSHTLQQPPTPAVDPASTKPVEARRSEEPAGDVDKGYMEGEQTFGRWVRQLRKGLDLTQEQLANQ